MDQEGVPGNQQNRDQANWIIPDLVIALVQAIITGAMEKESMKDGVQHMLSTLVQGTQRTSGTGRGTHTGAISSSTRKGE